MLRRALVTLAAIAVPAGAFAATPIPAYEADRVALGGVDLDVAELSRFLVGFKSAVGATYHTAMVARSDPKDRPGGAYSDSAVDYVDQIRRAWRGELNARTSIIIVLAVENRGIAVHPGSAWARIGFERGVIKSVIDGSGFGVHARAGDYPGAIQSLVESIDDHLKTANENAQAAAEAPAKEFERLRGEVDAEAIKVRESLAKLRKRLQDNFQIAEVLLPTRVVDADAAIPEALALTSSNPLEAHRALRLLADDITNTDKALSRELDRRSRASGASKDLQKQLVKLRGAATEVPSLVGSAKLIEKKLGELDVALAEKRNGDALNAAAMAQAVAAKAQADVEHARWVKRFFTYFAPLIGLLLLLVLLLIIRIVRGQHAATAWERSLNEAGDDVAFSMDEAEALETDAASRTAVLEVPDLDGDDQREIDEVFRALSEPVGRVEDSVSERDEAEALTTVAPLVPDMIRAMDAAIVRGEPIPSGLMDDDATRAAEEVDALKAQLRELEAAKLDAERERDLARAAEKAVSETPSQLPSARPSQMPSSSSHISGRDALALKKERNALEREVLDLKEKLTSREKASLNFHEREEELEARIVELEEALYAASSDKAELDAVLISERAKIAESERQNQDLKRKVADAAAAAQDFETRIAELETESSEREAAAAALQNDLGEALDAQKAALAELDGVKADLDGKKDRLSALENEVEATSAESSNLRQQLAAKGEELDTLTEQLTSESEKLATALAAIEVAQESAAEAESARQDTEGNLMQVYDRMREDADKRSKIAKALEIGLDLLRQSGYEPLDMPDEIDSADDLAVADVTAPI